MNSPESSSRGDSCTVKVRGGHRGDGPSQRTGPSLKLEEQNRWRRTQQFWRRGGEPWKKGWAGSKPTGRWRKLPSLHVQALELSHSGGLYLKTSSLFPLRGFTSRWASRYLTLTCPTEAHSTTGGRPKSGRDSLGAQDSRLAHVSAGNALARYARRFYETLRPLTLPAPNPWMSCSDLAPRIEENRSRQQLTRAASSACLLRAAAASWQIFSRSLIAAPHWHAALCNHQATRKPDDAPASPHAPAEGIFS